MLSRTTIKPKSILRLFLTSCSCSFCIILNFYILVYIGQFTRWTGTEIISKSHEPNQSQHWFKGYFWYKSGKSHQNIYVLVLEKAPKEKIYIGFSNKLTREVIQLFTSISRARWNKEYLKTNCDCGVLVKRYYRFLHFRPKT